MSYNIVSTLKWDEEILVGKHHPCVLIDRPFSVCLDESDGNKTIKFYGKLFFDGKNNFSIKIKAFGPLGMLKEINCKWSFYTAGNNKCVFFCTPEVECLSTNEGFKKEESRSYSL